MSSAKSSVMALLKIDKTYFFTVTAGRSGQESLALLLNKHVEGCYAAFEEPAPQLRLTGPLRDIERRVRRRFFETHELLGRGKVIEAFEKGNTNYLNSIALRKLASINQKPGRIYIDVSKYFARGLHNSLASLCPGFGLILLQRDPVSNMRSFLNRNKNFYLDNSSPKARSNIFRITSDDLSKGELYLWAWAEMSLRFWKLIEDFEVERYAVINTEDLSDAQKMNQHLDRLGLPHTDVAPVGPMNTNFHAHGIRTEVGDEDRELFQKFLGRVPANFIEKLSDVSPLVRALQ